MKQRQPKRMYYYIMSVVPYQGELIVMGKFNTEEEANRAAVVLPVPYEVVPLNTSDMKEAKDRCKAIYLQNTSDLNTTLNRTKHQLKGVYDSNP